MIYWGRNISRLYLTEAVYIINSCCSRSNPLIKPREFLTTPQTLILERPIISFLSINLVSRNWIFLKYVYYNYSSLYPYLTPQVIHGLFSLSQSKYYLEKQIGATLTQAARFASNGMRCCRNNWPGLCLFCCYY